MRELKMASQSSLAAHIVFGLAACFAGCNVAAAEDALYSAPPAFSVGVCPDDAGSAPKDRPGNTTAAADLESLHALVRRAAAAPISPKNHWAAGEVQFRGEWTTPDVVAQTLARDAQETTYRERRQKVADTADEHLQLATWCRSRGLEDKHDAHLRVAAKLDPNDPRPRRALGLVEYRGEWLTPHELPLRRQQDEVAVKSYQTWRSHLLKLRSELGRPETAAREQATSTLLAIRDPSAIPALVDLLSTSNEESALLVVRILRHMIDGAATSSLVRHAAWSGWPSVRSAALEALSERDPEHFVPALIGLLRPSTSGETWLPLGNGRSAQVSFMQSFDTTYLDIMLVNLPGPGMTLRSDHGLFAQPPITSNQLRDRQARRFALLEAENQLRVENARAALVALFGTDLNTDQRAWSDWWTKTHSGSIPDDTTPSRRILANVQSVSPPLVQAPTMSSSCFVAGTLVWTTRGAIAIDHIQLGDLALSQNMETGELAYRPVVRRTLRPRTAVMMLDVGDDTIGATLGHPFWVINDGWVRVKSLTDGAELRASGTTATLQRMTPADADYAYNLEVAEFQTYFVGKGKLLVHDNSPIRSSDLSLR